MISKDDRFVIEIAFQKRKLLTTQLNRGENNYIINILIFYIIKRLERKLLQVLERKIAVDMSSLLKKKKKDFITFDH